MPMTLSFHESQYPDQVAMQCRQGLRARKLPGRLLYDSPAQAQRWLAYHQAYSPSRTEPELLALYERSFQAAIAALTGQPLHYVSLGCGGGNKDALFVRHALDHGGVLHVSPTDTSPALVLETMLRLQGTFPSLSASPLVVDLAAEPDLDPWLAQQEADGARRVFGCFGIIPNFDYAALLSYLRRLMRPDDLLLISANLSPGPYGSAAAQRILPQYDNPLARAWFAGLLDSLGFAGSDLRLSVQARPLREDGHVWRIQADARVLQDVHLALYEESFDFHKGEVLEVFFSNRFTPAALPGVLRDAGFDVLQTWVLDSQEEGIYLCRRS